MILFRINQIMYNHSFSTIGLHAVETAESQMHCLRVNSTELTSLALPNITWWVHKKHNEH